MLFSSLFFLFFFLPLVLFVYYFLLQKQGHRNYFLLVSSLFFYAWGEPFFVFLMIASILTNYFIGLWIAAIDRKNQNKDGSKEKKHLLCFGILLNLIPFLLLKYEFFVLENLNILLSALCIPTLRSLELPLPIGISFFTFQAISYLVDVSRGTVQFKKISFI